MAWVSDGLWIGRGSKSKGRKFVRYPDGKFRRVDNDFDSVVLKDDEAEPKSQESLKAETVFNGVEPDDIPVNEVSEVDISIGSTFLNNDSECLVGVWRDKSGKLLKATRTPAGPRVQITPATFRRAFRELSEPRAKSVTWVTSTPIDRATQTACSMVADVMLVKVSGFVALPNL